MSAPDYVTMGDAAFAGNLDGTKFEAVAGYLLSPRAYHPWSVKDWHGIPGYKLPVWVAGTDGLLDGENALSQMRALGIPHGCIVAVDMETRKDDTYLYHFFAIMHSNGYKVWVYGSADTVFQNPSLNGYWVADYAGKGPFMYPHRSVRATQYESGPLFDSSLVKRWTLPNFWT